MKLKLIVQLLLAGAVVLAFGVANAAVTDDDFETETTQNLINLCTVSKSDPRAKEAIHFCHGYLVGAYDFHMAESSDSGQDPWVCFPTPEPSRDKAVAMFVKWARAHPQYMSEKPVETEFRFLMEQWPCKKEQRSE